MRKEGINLLEVDLQNIEKGVPLPGLSINHPLIPDLKLPVYIASYLIADQDQDISIGLPNYSKRDYAFAQSNGINIREPALELDEQNLIEALGDSKCRAKTEYKLKDWLVSRQRYWGCPIPILFCKSCGTISEDRLPLELPEIGDNTDILEKGRPLENVEEFQTGISCAKCQEPPRREFDTLDTFFDSSWYFLRFLDSQNKDELCRKELLEKWMPVDIYVGGMEHAIMHLLYARFVHKFICDELDIIDNDLREPFKELIV